MEISGLVADKFCLKLSLEDTCSNKLILPNHFVMKYSNRLDDSMELRVRNGYALPVKFDRTRGLLKGLLGFFKHFEFKGGEILLFEYMGRSNINVYILGINSSEIRYPTMVHYRQDCLPPMVTLGSGGLHFFCFKSDMNRNWDQIEVPSDFLIRCESTLSETMKYSISNGKNFSCSYCVASKKLTGLGMLFTILGVHDLQCYDMLLFSYDGNGLFTVSVFDESLYEIVIPGTPLSIEGATYFPTVGSYFEIIVEEKHLSDDCFFVEISNDFKWMCKKWSKCQSIKVYSGTDCWMLEIRKRDDYFCNTIEDGWKIFRKDFDLNKGDSCVFECAIESYEHFSVRVVRRFDFGED